jgi:tRNA threonylcarbamoyladenosine biosynthesis protein TsaE
MEIITKNAEDTKELGRKIGASLKGGEIFALTGNLGAGKTTFMQGFSEGLGYTGRLTSPTFILMRQYPLNEKTLYHLDLYRFEKNLEEEIDNLGVIDLWGRNENIMVIEWAEKIKDLLPEETRWIEFEILGDTERKITYEG